MKNTALCGITVVTFIYNTLYGYVAALILSYSEKIHFADYIIIIIIKPLKISFRKSNNLFLCCIIIITEYLKNAIFKNMRKYLNF